MIGGACFQEGPDGRLARRNLDGGIQSALEAFLSPTVWFVWVAWPLLSFFRGNLSACRSVPDLRRSINLRRVLDQDQPRSFLFSKGISIIISAKLVYANCLYTHAKLIITDDRIFPGSQNTSVSSALRAAFLPLGGCCKRTS